MCCGNRWAASAEQRLLIPSLRGERETGASSAWMGHQRFLWGAAAGAGFAVEKCSWACTLLHIRYCSNLHECIPQKTGFNACAVSSASLVARTKHAFILGEDSTDKPLMLSNPIPSFGCSGHCSASELCPLNPGQELAALSHCAAESSWPLGREGSKSSLHMS